MDRSLWLLLRLRTLGWLRRRARGLRTLKGALLAVVVGLFFIPMFLSTLFAPRIFMDIQLNLFRTYGALGLFGICMLNVVLAAGENVIHYSPAEVNLLFSAPYPPRQLLLYKIISGIGSAGFSALLMTFVFQHHVALPLAAFVSLFLMINLMYLFSLMVNLGAGVVGALAFSRGRRLLLLALGLVLAVALGQVGGEALQLPFRELLARLVRSPGFRVVLAPFEPFIRAAVAERIWPDLIGWALAGLAIDVALVALVLSLNARFIEASAVASARLYDRLRRSRQSTPWSGSVRDRYRFGVPSLAWWGGIGPNFWRQLTTASRSPQRSVVVVLFFAMPALMVRILTSSIPPAPNGASPLLVTVGLLPTLMIFAPSMVAYDFRSDLDRIEELKTLPVPAGRLAIAELLTPALILTVANWIGLGLLAALAPVPAVLAVGVIVLTVPLNFLLVAVENLYFLWFPVRWVPGTSADFSMMGRMIVFLFFKMLIVFLVGGVAAGVGALAYFAVGESWPAAIGASWVVLTACALGLVPLVALAFERFDVAAEQIE